MDVDIPKKNKVVYHYNQQNYTGDIDDPPNLLCFIQTLDGYISDSESQKYCK